LTTVRKEDETELVNLIKSFRAAYNDNLDTRKTWGGGVLGIKSLAK